MDPDGGIDDRSGRGSDRLIRGDDGHVYLFGEVLFDHFPDGSRVLGGAPFNVAWHLQAFGLAPRFVSRVGRDPAGDEVLEAMGSWGMETRFVQRDPVRPTGRVEVGFVDGEPHYEIVPDCAYDAIEPEPVDSCRLLYHGSLAARSETSARTLLSLREGVDGSVFVDVNLRPPWWQRDRVDELLVGADWVKLNIDELDALGRNGGDGGADGGAAPTDTDADRVRRFLRRYRCDGVLLTRGSEGAELLRDGHDTLSIAPDPGTIVVDTVGAGDAFAAVLLLGLCNDWPLPRTLERAQEFAAEVVGRRGATIPDRRAYRSILEQWQSSH